MKFNGLNQFDNKLLLEYNNLIIPAFTNFSSKIVLQISTKSYLVVLS